MKTKILLLSLGSIFLISCSSLESDAKKMANIECQLNKKPSNDEAFKLLNQLSELEKEYKQKYETQWQDFQEARRIAYQNCK